MADILMETTPNLVGGGNALMIFINSKDQSNVWLKDGRGNTSLLGNLLPNGYKPNYFGFKVGITSGAPVAGSSVLVIPAFIGSFKIVGPGAIVNGLPLIYSPNVGDYTDFNYDNTTGTITLLNGNTFQNGSIGGFCVA